MINSTDRANLTPEAAYEIFVGQITPEEFVAPFQGDAGAAINSLLADWPHEEEAPENIEHQIHEYLVEQGVAQ